MDRATDERWRAALEDRGMHVVRAELDSRPGRPGDLMYDYADGPPYPTRAFCEQWCRGAPPKRAGISGAGAMIIAMPVLIVVCIIQAISHFSPDETNWLSPHAGVFYRDETVIRHAGPAPSDDSVKDSTIKNQSQIVTTETSSILAPCSSVSDAHDSHTVQLRKSCMKSGVPPSAVQRQQQQAAPHS
jgi:hypothetical protein